MRVIAGDFRSRRLKSLPGTGLRPTPDRLRETLFDVLAPAISGSVFLDAYAGSGAVGIEALSRGAARSIFIEKSRAAVSVIHENLKSLGLEARAVVIHGAVSNKLALHPCDLAFLDPPYDLEREYSLSLHALTLAPPRLAIAQHSVRLKLRDEYGALRRVRVLKQGDNALSFYEPAGPPPC
jgi:16S rRNA (guanine(966)-N(2))-methyltransferase RsmD